MTNAIYCGTFDPITYGHIEIIKKSLNIFDNIFIVVSNNSYSKNILFSQNERIELIKNDIDFFEIKNVNIVASGISIIETIKNINSNILIRGVRNNIDFENEYKKLYNLETIFVPAMDIYQFISSSTIKHIISTCGDINEFFSKNTKCKLLEKYNKK